MSRFATRRAAAGDLERLVEIEDAAFDTDRISHRSFRAALASAAAVVLVAEADRRVAGYAFVMFRKNSRHARLYSIARAPEAPRGCGRALLAAVEAEAIRRGAQTLRLEVREDNAPALALYGATGFRAFGRAEDYYEDGAPALRLEKPLAPAVRTPARPAAPTDRKPRRRATIR